MSGASKGTGAQGAAPLEVGLLMFKDMLLLDYVGPWEVFSSLPSGLARVHRVAPSLEPVIAAKGFAVEPDTRLDQCPPLDVLCIPGGPGVTPLFEDAQLLEFIRRQAQQARFVGSVCTGSLLLGAAGLLQGRRAACHWLSLPLLAAFGAQPDPSRIVQDGPIVTGGGVTAGIDFGLHLVGEIWGREVAESIQLAIEYDPQPPFQAGSPRTAPAALVERIRQASVPMQAMREQQVRQAASRLDQMSRPGSSQSGAD